MDSSSLLYLATICAPLISPVTAHALVKVESNFNPFAIGLVGGSLSHQPRTHTEAVLASRRLAADGWNFSVGLAQINRSNFEWLGLSVEGAFDACTNLRAMQSVLIECFARASPRHTEQRRLRDALSCYYSGDFKTGYRHGYVQRVARATGKLPASSPDLHRTSLEQLSTRSESP